MIPTEPVRRRRRILRRKVVIPVALTVVALIVFVLVYFQPQKAFIDDKVNDAVPEDAQPVIDEADAPEFISLAHDTSGHVMVLDDGTGNLILRLVDLDTSNGPDLKVYLSTNTPDGGDDAFDDEFVNLGGLRGNVGSQNYDIPAGTDLAKYRSVVIWCDRFNVAFGAAELPEV